MPEDIKKTIQDLGEAFEQFKEANEARLKQIEDRGGADPLLKEKVERISADMSRIEAIKSQLETLETEVARGQLPGGTGDGQISVAEREHSEGFMQFMRHGVKDGLRDLEVKAELSTLSDPDAGFLMPPAIEGAIDKVAGTISAMRSICSTMTIGGDSYEKLVSQGGATYEWVAEKQSRSTTSTPTLAEIAINVKEISAKPRATQKSLDDVRIDLAAWLVSEVSESFDDGEGDSFISGNGVEKPKGINSYSKVANASYAWGKIGFITSGDASLLNDFDAMIDLQDALKGKYQQGANFLMNTGTKTTIRKLKDGEGNYLLQPGIQQGEPPNILGKPFVIDDNMPDIGAGLFPVAYGNFKRAYLILDRFGIRVLRDPYSAKPYVEFYITKRVGGGITMFEALKMLKISA